MIFCLFGSVRQPQEKRWRNVQCTRRTHTIPVIICLPLLIGGGVVAHAEDVAPGRAAVDREIEDGVLDWIHLRVEPPADDSIVIVHRFDASRADFGTGADGGKEKHVAVAAMMQERAPELVADA